LEREYTPYRGALIRGLNSFLKTYPYRLFILSIMERLVAIGEAAEALDITIISVYLAYAEL
jgi:hypothetical protein